MKHRRRDEPMHEAKVDVVTVPNLSEHLVSAETTAQLSARFAYAAAMKTANNLLLLVDGERDDDASRDDLAFWGRHEVEVAAEFGAASMRTPGEPDGFGWRDLPLDDARALARRSEAERAGGKGLAVDLRPHTDLWRVLEDLRASPTGSLQVEYGGSRLLFFESVYGDGAVAISAERDAVGRLLRVVVDLDCPPRE